MKAKTPTEFAGEILAAEPMDQLEVWKLFKEALEKWKKDPARMAELGVEMIWMLISQERMEGYDFKRDYMKMHRIVHHYAESHYIGLGYDLFIDCFLACAADKEKEARCSLGLIGNEV